MKNIILIAALMCCFISASAQPIRKESKQRSWKESLELVEKMNGRENLFTMKLDSVTMYEGDDMKVLFDYDEHFNCTWIAIAYLYDEWEVEFAYEYAYDEQDRLIAMIDYDEERKEEYFYNAQGLVEEILYSYYDEIWQTYGKTVLSYDEGGLLQLGTRFMTDWDGEWEPQDKTEYSYNAEGLCIEEIESEWYEGWNLMEKTVYQYNAQQLCSEKIEYGWGGGWYRDYKNTYDYDAEGNLLTEIAYYLNLVTEDWDYLNKYEFAYDANNNCIDYYEYSHDYGAEDWDLEIVIHTTYGMPGIGCISGLSLMWDLFEFGFPISNKVEQLIMDDDGDLFSLDFHYSSTTGIDEPMAGVFGVYPNPTKGILVLETQSIASLQGQTYRISNLMGQVLLQGEITAERQQIDVSRLAEGMYFVTVGNSTQKIVVNR